MATIVFIGFMFPLQEPAIKGSLWDINRGVRYESPLVFIAKGNKIEGVKARW